MDTINGYLSRRVQQIWPAALVISRDDGNGETWVLQRPGLVDVGLGPNYNDAQQAVHALIRAERKRRGDGS